ncbi:MAG TPA: UTP--glucose-1-phosphate uridylyltransferase, partial [Gemmatales bacterium]|nr:UTP--glucose-1-phosphate uridylyltransferase [Gemmatales bacterium]
MLRDEAVQILRMHGNELSAAQRASFEDQLAQLDFAELARLYSQSKSEESSLDLRTISTPSVIRLNDVRRHHEAKTIGESALKSGQLAIILVAGGQGTRLGHDAPKGTYSIGPVTQRSLFQIHAEKVLALSRRYGTKIPLLIMTSQENDAVTRDYFKEHRWFGLDASQVGYFLQGMLPALDAATGQVLLRAPGELALSPNGHG